MLIIQVWQVLEKLILLRISHTDNLFVFSGVRQLMISLRFVFIIFWDQAFLVFVGQLCWS